MFNQVGTFDPLDFTTTETVEVKDNGGSASAPAPDNDGPSLSQRMNAFEDWFAAVAVPRGQGMMSPAPGVDTLNTVLTTQQGILPPAHKSSTQLLREASRMEALAFMPSIKGIMAHPAVGVDLKVKLWDRLMAYGVGPKNTAKGDTHEKASNVQVAVIALQPRVAAESLLPLASPPQGGDTLSVVPLRPMTAIVEAANQLLKAANGAE